MRLAGEFSFEAPQSAVWSSLMDPEVLRAALPGTDRLDRLDDTNFAASWTVKLGPIRGSFAGSIVLSDVEPPSSYHMTSIGNGPIGVVASEADFRLRREGEATVLEYELETKISGRLVSVGHRLVESSMRSLVRDALQRLSERICERVSGDAGTGNGS